MLMLWPSPCGGGPGFGRAGGTARRSPIVVILVALIGVTVPCPAPAAGSAPPRPDAAAALPPTPTPAASPEPAAADRAGAPEAGELRYPDELADPIVASVYSLPSTLFSPDEAARFLGAVLDHAPDRTVLALVDPDMRQALAAAVEDPELHLLDTGDHRFSPWPRDPFSIVSHADGGLVLVDRDYLQRDREADSAMAAFLADSLPEELASAWGGVAWTRSTLPFHNGHVLMAGGAAWLSLHALEPQILRRLGVDRVPVESFARPEGIDRYLKAARAAIADLERLYGKPVRLVHPLPATGPAAERPGRMRVIGGGAGRDLDSLLTFLPGPDSDAGLRALVGDPGLGLELLSELGPDGWEALGDTYGVKIPDRGPPPELLAYQTSDRAAGLGRFLDLVADHLAAEGIRVDRSPLVLVPTGLLPNPEDFRHPDFLLGWNNAVVGPRGEAVVAEAFSSGIPEADRRAEELFEAAGARLVLHPPLVVSVLGNGGYRCASNQFRRAR